MRKLVFAITLMASLILNVVLVAGRKPFAPAEDVSFQSTSEMTRNESSDWDTFILALAWVESRWNPEAVGDCDDVGYLQITPILVADANRIAGKDTYSLSDRTSVEKSIEMFNVIQDRYNPTHDKNFSLKIWNPKASVAYHRKVMAKYNELIADQI